MAEGAQKDQPGVLRRKINAARTEAAEGGPGADRGWRLALARAARDQMKLPLEVSSLALAKVGLIEVLETPPERALLAVIEGPGEGMGFIALSAEVLQAMVEVLTIGRVIKGETPPRKPTRTDAAMVAGVIDAALIDLESGLEQEADLVWAGGWRYSSFLDDPRPLGLLLEDTNYRLMRAEVSLGLGARLGSIVLVLPAEGRGAMPARSPGMVQHELMAGPAFTNALAEQVEAADCVLDAVLSRLSLPLSRVLGLQLGEVLALPNASLSRVTFEGLDGRKLSEGKLGQNRGMRALRMQAPTVEAPRAAAHSSQAAHSPQAAKEPLAAMPPEPLRQSA